jgi:hypothetical protein
MHTLMIISRTQGISFKASEALYPLAIIEKLAALTGALLRSAGKAAREPRAHGLVGRRSGTPSSGPASR